MQKVDDQHELQTKRIDQIRKLVYLILFIKMQSILFTFLNECLE